MEIVTKPEQLRATCWHWRADGIRVALVPTMGYLHEGHLSLMRLARQQADKLVVSLFVNPTQFGPNEDLASYPRDLERDSRLAEANGVDVLFAPDAGEMYPPGSATWVQTPALASGLCGKTRANHFKGVATVVSKLLVLTVPHVAVFGEKDWQQLVIIRRMAKDLWLPVEIMGHPTVRESDGLALSSRNVYLSDSERAQAPHIKKGLDLAAEMARCGERSVETLVNAVRQYYTTQMPLAEIDYIEIVGSESLEPLATLDGEARIAVAVRFGSARLIDNQGLGLPSGR